MIAEHAEPLEADLQRYYGIALSDLPAGRLSWRRLGVLVRHLPLEAATVRKVHGDDVRWGTGDHLLAGIFDQLAWANW